MRIVLISQDPKDQEFLGRVSQSLSVSMQQFSSAAPGVDDLARDPAAMVFIDVATPSLYSAFENCVADKLGLYSALVNPNHYFFIAPTPFQKATYLHSSQICGNFIQRRYHDLDHHFFAKVLANTTSENAFGVERYLSDGAKCQSIQLKKSIEKNLVIDALQEYLARWGMNSRAAGLIVNAADELMLNAIYDAPVDDLGKPLYSTLPRNTSLDLPEKGYVNVKIAHDDDTIAISATDQYGSFDRQRLLSVLARDYQVEEFKVKSNVAGSGLGLVESFSNSAGAILVCEPGVKTEFMFFHKRVASFKDFRDQFRFLATHVIQN